MDNKQEKALYKLCLLNDVALQYGKLTLCDLAHYGVKIRKYRYQIHCDDKRATEPKSNYIGFSKLYKEDELTEAVDKFMELKQKIGPRVR